MHMDLDRGFKEASIFPSSGPQPLDPSETLSFDVFSSSTPTNKTSQTSSSWDAKRLSFTSEEPFFYPRPREPDYPSLD